MTEKQHLPIALPANQARLATVFPSEALNSERFSRMMTVEDEMRDGAVTLVSDTQPADTALVAEQFQAPQSRAKAFNRAMKRNDIDGIMVGWGGKLALEVLPLIDYEVAARFRRPIFGFSDGGTIINAITAMTGMVTFYGPNVAGKLDECETLNWGPVTSPPARNPTLLEGESTGAPTLQVTGRIVAGNLSTFVIGLSGTVWMPLRRRTAPTESVILMVECTESVQIQRQLLSALKNQGLLDCVVAIILGRGHRVDALCRASIEDALGPASGLGLPPTVFVDGFGHGHGKCAILPTGARAHLRVQDGRTTLTAIGSVVATAGDA